MTEGHEKSFDSVFYRWLLDDSKAEVFPCGNCHDVKQVINKSGLWGQISTDVRMAGIIDSDFRSIDEMERLASGSLVGLKLHEAESYVCLPEVLSAAASKIGSQERPPTENDIKTAIFAELQSQKMSIALKRSFSESAFTVRMFLEKSVIVTVSTKEEALRHIREKSAEEVSKAVDAMSEAVFEEKLDKELSEIDRIVNGQDVIEALRILPGKQLLARFAPLVGCKNGTDLMRSIKRNLSIADYSIMVELAAAVNAALLLDNPNAQP